MSLIDANAFATCLERMTKTAYPNLFPGLLEAIDYVKDFPTVDAVEVVRCKDCTHNRKAIDEKGWGIFCSIWGRGWHRVEPDDFCSYGERRIDND